MWRIRCRVGCASGLCAQDWPDRHELLQDGAQQTLTESSAVLGLEDWSAPHLLAEFGVPGVLDEPVVLAILAAIAHHDLRADVWRHRKLVSDGGRQVQPRHAQAQRRQPAAFRPRESASKTSCCGADGAAAALQPCRVHSAAWVQLGRVRLLTIAWSIGVSQEPPSKMPPLYLRQHITPSQAHQSGC